MIRLGLIGYPVEHSLSPPLHRAALESCGLEGEYTLFPVAPDDRAAIRDVLDRMRAGDLDGLNITIPHKRTVAECLDARTPTATAVGAINVVYRDGETLVGDNTDVPGFLAALKRFLDAHGRPFGRGRPTLVLGAGGSGRAVTYGLLASGWDVTVTARRQEQACELAGDFADHEVRVLDYADLPAALTQRQLDDCALIVNATPIGMAPDVTGSPWPEGLPFPPGAAVYDLVYAPRVTRLVREACAQGIPAATGLEMLVEQALLSFVRWTGRTPSREIMLEAVR